MNLKTYRNLTTRQQDAYDTIEANHGSHDHDLGCSRFETGRSTDTLEALRSKGLVEVFVTTPGVFSGGLVPAPSSLSPETQYLVRTTAGLLDRELPRQHNLKLADLVPGALVWAGRVDEQEQFGLALMFVASTARDPHVHQRGRVVLRGSLRGGVAGDDEKVLLETDGAGHWWRVWVRPGDIAAKVPFPEFTVIDVDAPADVEDTVGITRRTPGFDRRLHDGFLLCLAAAGTNK